MMQQPDQYRSAPAPPRHAAAHPRNFRGHGFTMLEVLLAMGIFAIGFAMVATIFPSAILLQKRTIEDVQGQQAARNAEASIKARPFDGATLVARLDATYGTVSPYWDDDERVYALPPEYLDGTYTAGLDEWMLADRSYPLKRSTASTRKFYWVPLVQDTFSPVGINSLRIYVFVLKRRQTDTYGTGTANPADGSTVPAVIKQAVALDTSSSNRLLFPNNDLDSDGIPDLLKENDQILDTNGNIYTVISADTNGVEVSSTISNTPNTVDEIWYAPPGDSSQPSPTVSIFFMEPGDATK